MSRRPEWILASLAALSLFPACGSESDLADESGVEVSDVDGKDDSLSSTSTYFSVRPDFRKCISPLCGGVYVSKLNATAGTTCLDGSHHDACYVPAIDFTAAGLTPEDFVDGGAVIVRGRLAHKKWDTFGDLGVFKATEAWGLGSGTSLPLAGTFYRLTDNHIACIAAPCFTTHEAKLNWTTSTNLSGMTSADPKLAPLAQTYLAESAILVAGTNKTVPHAGPAGTGKVVNITQFYKRVNHIPVPSCDTVKCTATTHCELVQVECFTTPCYPIPECVPNAPFCGGIAGRPCPGNGQCTDNPNDNCDPALGGADCGGLCVCPPNNKLCINGTHWDGSASVCACVPDQTGPACGKVTCAFGQVCCNPLMDICVNPGQVCIQ